MDERIMESAHDHEAVPSAHEPGRAPLPRRQDRAHPTPHRAATAKGGRTPAAGPMGSRVLLLSVNQYDFPYPVFPLGAALVNAALRQGGHEVRFVDYNVNHRPLPDLIAEFRPDYVGISLRNIDDALIQKRETFFETLLEWLQNCADIPMRSWCWAAVDSPSSRMNCWNGRGRTTASRARAKASSSR